MKRKPMRACSVLLVLFSLLIVGCSGEPKEQTKFGNSNQNIDNAGLSVTEGDWIYFTNISAKNALYKIKKDRTGEAMITPEGSYSLNYYDGWIVYCSAEDNKIYRIKPDGTEKQKLGEQAAQNTMVYDGWIYSINRTDETKTEEYSRIYKMKLDGTSSQTVGSAKTGKFNITQEGIYYSDGETIHRMKPDGSEDTELGKASFISLQVVGDHIYYITQEANNIWRMKLDGTGPLKLSEDKVSAMNVSGDWIYYGNTKAETMGIEFKKMKLDGSEPTVVNNEGPLMLNIHEDIMVYLTMDFASFSMKETIMNTDGTNRKDYLMTPPTSENTETSYEIYGLNETIPFDQLTAKCLSAFTSNVMARPDENRDPLNDRITGDLWLCAAFELTNQSSEAVILKEQLRLMLPDGGWIGGRFAVLETADNQPPSPVSDLLPEEDYQDSMILEPGKKSLIQAIFLIPEWDSEQEARIGLYGGAEHPMAAVAMTPVQGHNLIPHEQINDMVQSKLFPKSEVYADVPITVPNDDTGKLEVYYVYIVTRPEGKKEYYLIRRGNNELFEGKLDGNSIVPVKQLEFKNYDD
ncbi:MAG: DUF5050 domain-containing protein [Clostridiaceae bacterium]